MKRNKIKSFLILLILCGTSAYADVRGDDTKINQIDDAAEAVTADQQPSSSKDLQIARKIRQELLADKSLSVYGQNVKVTSEDGVVILKGPVRSDHEEAQVLKCAQAIVGATNVVNKMQVAQSK